MINKSFNSLQIIKILMINITKAKYKYYSNNNKK